MEPSPFIDDMDFGEETKEENGAQSKKLPPTALEKAEQEKVALENEKKLEADRVILAEEREKKLAGQRQRDETLKILTGCKDFEVSFHEFMRGVYVSKQQRIKIGRTMKWSKGRARVQCDGTKRLFSKCRFARCQTWVEEPTDESLPHCGCLLNNTFVPFYELARAFSQFEEIADVDLAMIKTWGVLDTEAGTVLAKLNLVPQKLQQEVLEHIRMNTGELENIETVIESMLERGGFETDF